MNEKLIEYLKKHLESGSDMGRVKQALLSAGHDINTIERHINHVLKHKKLGEYIKKHIEIGSDIDKVKQALLNAGYDINIVEEQLRKALEYGKSRRHKLKIISLSAAVMLVVIISVAGFYYFPDLFKKTGTAINGSRIEEIRYQKDLNSLNQALITNDTNVCDRIEGDALKNECKRKFENELNKTEGKISLNETADKKSFNMALTNHNESICLKIKESSLRNQCEQML